MNSKQKEEFKKVVLELDKWNMNDHIILSIEDIENDNGKMTKHIIAKWEEVVVDQLNGHGTCPATKVEEMNKFFSGELFALGITQKAAWIKADIQDKVAYLEAEPFGHPSLFPVWLEGNKDYHNELKPIYK